MTTLEAILPQHIDSTMMACFRQCKRKFMYEFVYGLRPPFVSIDLHCGGVFAKTIERFQRKVHEEKLPVNLAMNDGINFMIKEWGDVTAPSTSPKSLDRTTEAFLDYIATYPPGTDPVQPYTDGDGKTSYEFSAAVPLDFEGFPMHPSGEPFIYCGRFDLLGFHRERQRPCVRDEKTGKAAGDKWAEQWDLRSQFLGYSWLGQQSGIENLNTVVVRGVIIQKTQIKQLEAVKVYPQYLIERWFDQLRRDLTVLRRCWDEGYFDYDLSDACSSYGGCVFKDICTSPEDTQPNWMSNFIVKRWNPLLHNPIEVKDDEPLPALEGGTI